MVSVSSCRCRARVSIRDPITKEAKYVDYEVLLHALHLMHEARKKAEKLGGLSLPWLVHDELLMSWLVRMVWRQGNIRRCRIGHNLFYKPIPALVNMSIPSWVREMINKNPQEPPNVWQVWFPQGETKTHREIRQAVRRCLVGLLEEYLAHYRPLLLQGSSCENLFLNRNGGALTTAQLTSLVSELTLQYAGRRVTPHIVRDIFAFWFLRKHPGDYPTLSKMLWHSNLSTTMNIYGAKFDESAALCRVEELCEQDANQSAHQSSGKAA